MTVPELKAWMKKFGKSEVDIASILKLHPNTVIRFLKGKPAHKSTVAALERMVSESNGGKPSGT